MSKELLSFVKGDALLYLSILLGGEVIYLLHNGKVWGGIVLAAVLMGALLYRMTIKKSRDQVEG